MPRKLFLAGTLFILPLAPLAAQRTTDSARPPLLFREDWKETPAEKRSGEARGNWAVSLRYKERLMDLSGASRVRWRTQQTVFGELRMIVQQADDSWLVSDQSDPGAGDWRDREFILAGTRSRRLDIGKVSQGPWAAKPDLSRVREVGFTGLMQGGARAACSRLDWNEAYGRIVP